MSYILDALNKAAREKEAQGKPRLTVNHAPLPESKQRWWPWVIFACVVNTLLVGGIIWFYNRPHTPSVPARPEVRPEVRPEAHSERQVAAQAPTPALPTTAPPTPPAPTIALSPSIPVPSTPPATPVPTVSPVPSVLDAPQARAPSLPTPTPAATSISTLPIIERFSGKVIGIKSGCLIELRSPRGIEEVTLAGIRCDPENPTIYQSARKLTTRTVFTKPVRIHVISRATPNQVVAEVQLMDQSSLNELLVRQGLAWTVGQGVYHQAEAAAKRDGRGIWSSY